MTTCTSTVVIASAIANCASLPNAFMSTLPDTVSALHMIARGGEAEIFALSPVQVVKLFRAGLARSAVETEWHHARTAHASGIPTPRPEEMIEIEGRHGIVLERCDGPTLFDLILQRKFTATRLAEIFFGLQRAIHGCDGSTLPPIGPRIAIKIRHAAGVSDAVKQSALDHIACVPQGTAFCHGDLHPANVIMCGRGPVVVDWMNAGRGEAAMDLVRARLLLEYARPDGVDTQLRAEFLQAYAACCRDAGFTDSQSTTRWLLPVAVARLAEPIGDTERRALLDLVARVIASAAHTAAV